MKKSVILVFMAMLSWNAGANASGAIVAGGKTNSAIVIYDGELDATNREKISGVLEEQVAQGNIRALGDVMDDQGRPAKCAQFKLLQTFNETLSEVTSIATDAGAPSAVRPVGSCTFDTIN